ncbi:T9SS type A sorting domain-containing protein [Chryseolinea lacunae]|uniref:T9SS type A sorting domain-containing protein n=1 Tax=Chryseolinea lacunae TaxID=2801331 RepID=A0ABS1KMH1_9BACT|nr:T9SS type A sorting domain-containing protein [Chryseolinea lacunae]MBL0739852.1 T9SS type A sorting domain-containing protein [Chryseolinea lacunae]
MKKTRLLSWSFLLLAFCLAMHADAQFSRVALPAGLQPTSSEMVIYQSKMYMVLQNAAHNSYSLHKYDGATFTTIPLPAGYRLYEDTHFEEMKGNLYFMPDHDASLPTPAELMRYDGTTLTPIDVPDALVPRDEMQYYFHRPFAFDGNLYMEVLYLDSIALDPFTITYWIKYDGVVFSRMLVDGIFTCQPSDGTPIGLPSDKKLFQGKMFMRYYHHITRERNLLNFDGTEIDVDSEHPVAWPGGCEMEVFNGSLYVPTFTPTSPGRPYGGGMNRFNGTTQTAVSIPPTLRYAETTLEVYGERMFGAMYDGSSVPRWYAFNGTSFALVPTPAGTSIYAKGDQRVFQCQLYITLRTSAAGAPPMYALYTYTDALVCGTSVIPEPFDRFSSIDIRNYGHERDWCWTGINVVWTPIAPCTPPDCIDPFMKVSLFEKPENVTWSASYQKPFQALFPIEDKKPLVETLTMGNANAAQNVIIFDKDLVPSGIENIALQLKPQEKLFNLTVETEKDKTVPFTMTLLDANGKSLWQGKFVAPLATRIDAVTSQRGTTLRFAPVLPLQSITSVSVYPNPAASNTAIDISTRGTNQTATIAISNLNGKVVYQKEVNAPAVDHPDLSQIPKGLYIVTVTTGAGYAHRQMLAIK